MISRTTKLTSDDLRIMFQGTMVGFVHWRAARGARWPVRFYSTQDREEVGGLLTMYYRDGLTHTKHRDWHEDDARFPRMFDIYNRMHEMSADDRQRIFGFVTTAEAAQRRTIITLPALEHHEPGDKSRGTLQILDGLHRCLGLMMMSTTWTLNLFALRHPTSENSWAAPLL